MLAIGRSLDFSKKAYKERIEWKVSKSRAVVLDEIIVIDIGSKEVKRSDVPLKNPLSNGALSLVDTSLHKEKEGTGNSQSRNKEPDGSKKAAT